MWLKKIEGYQKEKKLIRETLKPLDTAALKAITTLHRHFAKVRPPGKGGKQSPAYALRMLCLDILENWGRLTCCQRPPERLRDNLGRKRRRSNSPQHPLSSCLPRSVRSYACQHSASWQRFDRPPTGC